MRISSSKHLWVHDKFNKKRGVILKLRILTHSGESVEVIVEEFDPKAVSNDLNDNEVNTIELGGVIFSRIDVKMIRPIQE